jgi:solute:Na+ symporter, SSS family
MQFHTIDIIIMSGYLSLTVLIGFWVRKRAAKNMNSYFLGGNMLPWWMLSVSQSSGMFDISGTMWMVYLCFVYGFKSIWIPFMYPFFLHVFNMVYMNIWVRRSNVLTGAEWLTTRFGTGRGANLSSLSIVIFAFISVVGFTAYAFIGIGKFAAIFLPWDLSYNVYGIIIISITTLYVLVGGFHSVALTSLVQFILMSIACFSVGIIAMLKVSPEMLAAVTPAGWDELWFGWKLNLDWSGIIDELNVNIKNDGYSMIGAFMMMMVAKGFLVSAAGPTPNYDMQRALAVRNVKEAAYMSAAVSPLMMLPRYFLVGGISILALVFYKQGIGTSGSIDFENILPFVIHNFIPAGVMGLLLAGLLAAFMSTHAATINAGAAYLVNDLYKKYIRPGGTDRQFVRAGYISTLLILLLGIGLGLTISSINELTQWLFSAFWGGYIAANVLKWYWWRLNGMGYFIGMVSGIGTAMILPLLFPSLSAIEAFPIIFICSLVASVVTSLTTLPDDVEVLKSFYRQVRPWGFWKPVLALVQAEDSSFEPNRGFKKDMFNILVGTVWQTALSILPLYVVIRKWGPTLLAMLVVMITSVLLKYFWYNKLPDK